MSKKYMRFISMVLIFCICFINPFPCVSETEERTQAQVYRDRVIKRYESSFEHSDYYQTLLNDHDFIYEKWIQEVEDSTPIENLFIDIASFALEKPLDSEAYTEYLLKLMLMLESGMTDTISAQASYNALNNGWNYISAAPKILAGILIGGETAERIGKALDYFGIVYDIGALIYEIENDAYQLAVVSAQSALYLEKTVVLQAIMQNTDDTELRIAAEALQCNFDAQYAVSLGNYKEDALKIGIDIGEEVTDVVLGANIIDTLLPYLTEKGELGFARLAKVINDEKAKELFEPVLEKTLSFAKYLNPFAKGLVIGAEIMKLAVGNEMECFREMMAMSKISEALQSAMIKANNEAAAINSADERYETIRSFVALGEALTYARLRGDYCYLLAEQLQLIRNVIIELEGDTSKLLHGPFRMKTIVDMAEKYENFDEKAKSIGKIYKYYEYLEENMLRTNKILAGIFPDTPYQVIFTAHRAYTDAKDCAFAAIYEPNIEIVGNKEATDKINSPEGKIGEIMQEVHSKGYEYVKSVLDRDDNGLFARFSFSLEYIDCFDDVLCMTFAYMGNTKGSVYYNEKRWSLMYDINTGEMLYLNDMLNPDNKKARKQLIEVIAKAIEEQEGWVYTTFEDIAECVVDRTLYEGYYDFTYVPVLTKDELVLEFPAASILPNAGGAPRITIKNSELEGILAPRYVPRDKEYDVTNLYFFYPDGNNSAPQVLKTHGQESLEAIYCVEDVRDVCVREIRYAEKWPEDVYGFDEYSGIVFYANFINDDLYWIPENEFGSYSVTFNGITQYCIPLIP